MTPNSKAIYQCIIGLLFIIGGLWHAAAPWIMGYESVTRAVWSNVIAGAVLAVVGAFYAAFNGGVWLNYIAAVIGIWVMIAPEILGVGRPWLASLEASWGGPIVIALVTIAALDLWFERSPHPRAGHTMPA